MSLIVEILRSVMAKYGLQLDSNLTLAIKSIANVKTLPWHSNPNSTGCRSRLRKRRASWASSLPSARRSKGKTQAVRSAKDFLRELPALQDGAGQWLEQLRTGALWWS